VARRGAPLRESAERKDRESWNAQVLLILDVGRWRGFCDIIQRAVGASAIFLYACLGFSMGFSECKKLLVLLLVRTVG